jgi:hypothetical protein
MRMNANRNSAPLRLVVIAVVGCALTHAASASAEDATEAELLETASVIVTQSCNGIAAQKADVRQPDIPFDGHQWRAVSTRRVSFFLVSHSAEETTPAQALDDVRKLEHQPNTATTDASPYLRKLLYNLEFNLNSGQYDGMRAFTPENKVVEINPHEHNHSWITRPDVILRCKLPDVVIVQTTTPPAVPGQSAQPADALAQEKGGGFQLRLRGDVDALQATGNDRQSASAANFGYTRTRTFQDDGSRTETNEYAVKAVLGSPLIDRPNSSLTAYAGYELKQNRSRPAPALVPPATERDGDTDIVTFGLIGGHLVPLGGNRNRYASSLTFQFGGSYKFDRVKQSERTEGRFSASYYNGTPLLGLCTLGGLKDFGNGFWSHCDLTAIGTYNVITRHGRLPVSTKDHYGHLGGKVSAALYYGDPSENTAFATADYQYMARVDGDPAVVPVIERHSFTLGYRWWRGDAFALEVKAALTDGINPDSFADENTLSLGFGILF